MDVKLPNLGEGADSGTVINLFVKEGDQLDKDQPILEIENEKAVATIPSTAAGVITKIFVKSGDKISAGQRILSLDGPAGSPSSAPTPSKAAKPEPRPQTMPAPSVAAAPVIPSNGEVAAAPSLRKLAGELGIDLSRVRGSERGGRIVLADIRAYIQGLIQGSSAGVGSAAHAAAAPAKAEIEKVDFSKWGPIYKRPMTSLRKVISRRMSENWNVVPHVTQFDEANLERILELRKKHLAVYEAKGAKLTVTGFVLTAVAAVLKQHPVFNASLDETAEEIVFKEYCHIGIAVDTEAGLIVPVLRNVEAKTLLELSTSLEELAKRARDRKVSAEELKGGSFTISNQGGIGSAHFTPIVNKPEVAILGLGKGAQKPVAVQGQVKVQTMLPLALSYDHRVIDGGSAARFMVDFVQALENFKEEAVVIG